MKFLNPRTDFAFKKVFGSETSKDILISFLNAVLALTDQEVIVSVNIIDPYLAPKIQGLKNTFLDVRVLDQKGRSYIVEMQILNVEGFEKRILYNACKAYVNQLSKSEPYHLLTEVVAITLTDFYLFKTLSQVVSRFRLSAEENPLIYHKDLELVFVELPKFIKKENELENTLDRWLYFLKMATDLESVPTSLAIEPTILKAFEVVNYASWTREELDDFEKRQMWITEQKHILDKLKRAEEATYLAQEQAKQAEAIALQLQIDKERALTEKEKERAEKERLLDILKKAGISIH